MENWTRHSESRSDRADEAPSPTRSRKNPCRSTFRKRLRRALGKAVHVVEGHSRPVRPPSSPQRGCRPHEFQPMLRNALPSPGIQLRHGPGSRPRPSAPSGARPEESNKKKQLHPRGRIPSTGAPLGEYLRDSSSSMPISRIFVHRLRECAHAPGGRTRPVRPARQVGGVAGEPRPCADLARAPSSDGAVRFLPMP